MTAPRVVGHVGPAEQPDDDLEEKLRMSLRLIHRYRVQGYAIAMADRRGEKPSAMDYKVAENRFPEDPNQEPWIPGVSEL